MKYTDVVDATNEILEQYDMRLTIRQIYYRLVSPPYQLFNNLSSKYKQFDRILTRARERGDINWRKIEDRSRTTLAVNWLTANSKLGQYYVIPRKEMLGDIGFEGTIDDFIAEKEYEFKESWKYFTRPIWKDQPLSCEVWVEKDALAGIISSIAKEYRVLTYPSRGYSSFTRIMEALEDRFCHRWQQGQPVHILHLTDHDPSGLDMSKDISKRFDAYIVDALRSRFTNDELDLIKEKTKSWEQKGYTFWRLIRVALTYDQVQEFNLAPNPTKLADPRAKWYVQQFGNECWELDALPPDELQRIVKKAILSQIDFDIWNKAMEAIQRDQEEIKQRLNGGKKLNYE